MHANQHTSDPREQVAWDIYIKKLTTGRDNAYESAKEAGYSEDHSKNITLNGWWQERKSRLKRKDMLSKAERNLDRTLDFDVFSEDGKVNVPVASLVNDISKTIIKTLGKDVGYSERTELTGKDGKDIIPEILSEEQKEKLRTLL